MKKLVSLVVLVAYLLSFSISVSAQRTKELEGEISLSGAFALYPMAVKWADEFKKLHPKVKIDISGGGAGKGITDVLAKVIDLGMVSREIHAAETQRGAVPFAVVKDAVIPTINANNPNLKDIKRIGLKKEIALKLWSGEIKTWGQVLGTKSNVPVYVFTRSDACGAAETWAAWFGKKQEDLDGTAVFGDPGVASAVQKEKVGIGYNNIAYAYDQKTKRPYAGIEIIPLDVNGNGKIDAEENFYGNTSTLIRAIASNKYPSPPARNIYFVSNGKPTKPAVIEFLKFVLSTGQKYANESGYIGLSKTTLRKEEAKLGK